MNRLKLISDQIMKVLNKRFQDDLNEKADKKELHSHTNKDLLDTITQKMLDSFATGGSGSSGASDEIVLGTEINLIKPCKKGFVGMTDYGEKRYGEINRLSYFYMPYPLLYVDEEISEDSANPTFYRQKLISIEYTAFNDGESTIVFTKGELVYLRGTLGSSRRVFTLDYMTPVTQDVMSENDMYYMLLGLATSEKELYLFSEHPIFKTSEGTFCEIGLKTVGLIEGMNFGTIEPTQFKANTDEYKDYYPYYVDLYDNRLKEYSWVEVNYTPATLQLGCMSAQVRIMNGILRLYADEIPSGNIDIDNVFFKEVN